MWQFKFGLFTFVLLLLSVIALAKDKGKATTKPAESVAPVKAGIWKPLVTPGAKWVLKPSAGEGQGALVIETYDVRTIAGANVARLRWKTGNDEVSGHPEQIAIRAKGAWFLGNDYNDEVVARVLKKAPTYLDPPKLIRQQTRKDGAYVVQHGKVLCVGEGPPPHAGECEDICYGEVCFADGAGIVRVDGRWSPDNYSAYAADGY